MRGDAYLGKTIGNYLIQELVSAGRLGPVFRAEHLGLRRQVALRLLVPQFPEELQRRSLGYRGDILQRLSHPNLPELLDFGELSLSQYGSHHFYSAFAWYAGHDLEVELSRRGPLSEGVALELARQVGSALWAAHQAGLAHMSLECGDVLLVGGAPQRLKVLDFGVGKYTAEPGWEAELAARRRNATYNPPPPSSPLYWPPEALLGAAGGAPAADVYALGVVLYKALTAESPFAPQSSIIDFILQAARGGLALREHPRVSPRVWPVLTQLLAPAPAQRFASMREVLDALERLLSA